MLFNFEDPSDLTGLLLCINLVSPVRLDLGHIRVNDQWRICFTWREGDAFDVKIVGYHKR